MTSPIHGMHDHPESPLARSFRRWYRKDGIGYLFLAPFVILFSLFVLIPIVVAIQTSLTSNDMIQPARWLGIQNYKNLFVEDEVFMKALENTLVFVLITGPIGFTASFLFAWIIDSMKLKRLFSLAFYAPSIVSSVAMTIIWGNFFSSDTKGWLNRLLLNIGLISRPVLWNLDAGTILPVIIIISIWTSMGTGFLVFMAGLKNVPAERYESGRIDGISGRFQELWYITLPSMKPQLLFGVISSLTGAFSVFDIAVNFAGLPSANNEGLTVVGHLYDYAFNRFQMGYASAIAVILFVLTFSLGQIAMRTLSERD